MKIYFKNSISQENFFRGVSLGLLFLAGMNFKNMYYYLMLCAAIVFFLSKRTIVVDKNVIVLALLAASWLLFSPDRADMGLTFLIEPCLYPIAYIMGRNFFYNTCTELSFETVEKKIQNTIIIIVMAPYIHYMLNYITNIGYVGRNSIDIWTNSILSATNQATMGVMALAVAVALLLISEKIIIKIISVIVILSVLLYNLQLSGRTLIVMLVLIGVVCSVYVYFSESNHFKKIKIAIGVFCFIGIGYFLFAINIFGVQEYVLDSNLYNRFLYASEEDIATSGRLELKLYYLKNFYLSFWGGRNIFGLEGKYAHDLFLDTYDEAGIFALILIILFMISSLIEIIYCMKNTKLRRATRVMLLALYLAIFMQCMVEPILQGVQWFFTLFCFIHGNVIYLSRIESDLMRSKKYNFKK